ncbi:DNA polymerase nu [Centroberyx affinis]|uniref:DNA polymerase nu n=1 Tax=Centroberyx affinis TaxID=166261 RepID=UPI003A5BBF60
MERCSSRLYSGPLSQSAQKVLAVLRAQSRHTARNHYSNSSNYRHSESGHRHGGELMFDSCIVYVVVDRYYGSQREHQAQSSRSRTQEESRDTDTDQPQVSSSSSSSSSSNRRRSSQIPAYYQYSQTPDYSQASQASSSSYWDSSFQRQSSQTPAHYQYSQTYSQREHSQLSAYQSSQALPFTQKGTKLGQKGKNDFGFRVHASEREGPDHQLGSEDKEITEGYHNEKEKMAISVDGRDHGVTRCQAENPQNMGETETEPGEKHQTEGPKAQQGPPKVKPALGDITTGNLERTIEERIDVMEGELEVERKAEAGNETNTEEEMEKERLHCSRVQLRDGQGETEDCGEGNELPGRNIVPEDRRKDRDESLMTDVDRKYGSTSTVLRAEWKRAKRGPDSAPNEPKTALEGANSAEPQNQSKAACLTVAMTSDPRVKDAGKLNPEERIRVLEEAGKARALVLTMVYRDGTTQLDPEQKLPPAVCGLLVLMKRDLDRSAPQDSLGPNDSLVYLKLEHTPVWAQQHTQHSQERFTREMLLQVLSRSQLVVCYKAKDLLRTALQLYREHLNWKQVAGCRVQDPQVSGWLLDPADPASCYQDLLTKHCRKPPTASVLGTKKVSQVISSLTLLYWLNMELCSKLQSQGLWELYSDMELSMIPVLAAMESHRIHVDKEALKRTSDMLGTKLKQLEQEAHQAAGQIFLVSSSTQLRTVLFEKLRLHERCENKKLPKTINKQQQSTSEAALLQLQDLHPLPKIILEYRQVHKIKSTFVDGILSCMMSKNYISSTWCQTSVVTGRISAKHPNFQALPRQPVQITKKQYIQGKEVEVVTVHPRAMFIPQEGWTFLAADFCQVELRLLAHLSSDPELLRIFTNPQADVFTMLASQWKGVSEGEVTSEEREHAKRIVYSVVYGAGRERLSGILGVSAEQASRFQDSFLQTYREVQAFIHRTIQQCHKQGHVLSIMGRRRTLPNIHSPDWGIRMQAERQAVNFVVQGSAADLCKMAMIRIFSQVSSSSSLSARLIAQLHDELLYEVEDSQVEQFAALVKSTMESLQHIDCLGVHLKVPLKVAVSSGKSWGSMSELNIPPASPSP